MLSIECVCLAGFSVAWFSAVFLGAPPQLFDPQGTKFLGRWIHLTYWSNVSGVVFFATSVADATMFGDRRRQFLLCLFPLIFGAGCFLTLAYYGLDHFNAESIRKKERCRGVRPYIFWNDHLAHGHALPLVLLHAATLEAPPGLRLPTSSDALFYVPIWIMCYLVTTHVNRWATGLWPYPIIDEVTRAGGAAARCGFFAVLAAALTAFALAGVQLVHLR